MSKWIKVRTRQEAIDLRKTLGDRTGLPKKGVNARTRAEASDSKQRTLYYGDIRKNSADDTYIVEILEKDLVLLGDLYTEASLIDEVEAVNSNFDDTPSSRETGNIKITR